MGQIARAKQAEERAFIRRLTLRHHEQRQQAKQPTAHRRLLVSWRLVRDHPIK
jgi:hypothetical protein